MLDTKFPLGVVVVPAAIRVMHHSCHICVCLDRAKDSITTEEWLTLVVSLVIAAWHRYRKATKWRASITMVGIIKYQ